MKSKISDSILFRYKHRKTYILIISIYLINVVFFEYLGFDYIKKLSNPETAIPLSRSRDLQHEITLTWFCNIFAFAVSVIIIAALIYSLVKYDLRWRESGWLARKYGRKKIISILSLSVIFFIALVGGAFLAIVNHTFIASLAQLQSVWLFFLTLLLSNLFNNNIATDSDLE